MNPAPKAQTVIRKPLLTALLNPEKLTQRIEIKQIDFAPDKPQVFTIIPAPWSAMWSAAQFAFRSMASLPAR
jgi:hypothetical protein